jgi:hypothetical protein
VWTTILVQEQNDDRWGALFKEAAQPRQIGLVLLFPLLPEPAATSRACRAPI